MNLVFGSHLEPNNNDSSINKTLIKIPYFSKAPEIIEQ